MTQNPTTTGNPDNRGVAEVEESPSRNALKRRRA